MGTHKAVIAASIVALFVYVPASNADGIGGGAKRPLIQLTDGIGGGAKRPLIAVA